MGIGVQRIYWLGVLLWGCASHPIAEKEPWSVGAAVLLRTQLDADAAIVAVDAGLLSRFYLQRDDRPAWCGPTGPRAQADALLRMLRQATDDGLRLEDYGLERIEDGLGRWRNPGAKPSLASTMRLEVLLTRAFLAYAGHLQRGRVDPRAIHPQWQAPMQAADLSGLLQTALDLQQVESALARLRPPQAGYYHLRQALRAYREIAAAGGWLEVEPSGGAPLLRRLVSVGDLAGGMVEWSRAEMQAGIAQFQERHGLDPNGHLDAPTLAALNVPVADRLAAIELNMERWRWLPHDPGTRYILVRIADFELDAVEAGETVLNMRVIVGKPYWRTPIFSAELTRLVFNPFWYIPRSIAVEEILPIIRRDPDYLQRRDMLVTTGEGLELVKVDPDSVDWADMTGDNFAYAFTQTPGPANPLGKIKFLFPNPYNIYLHDTPNTELFSERIRAFSHGCIRLEKSAELAAYALQQEGQWPLGRVVREVASGVNREIALGRAMPVYLLYWTTWIDAAGLVQFRQDDYDADLHLRRMLSRK